MFCALKKKEPSHRDGSFEYPQHIFWLRNKNSTFQLRNLILGPVELFSKHKNRIFNDEQEKESIIGIHVYYYPDHRLSSFGKPHDSNQ